MQHQPAWGPGLAEVPCWREQDSVCCYKHAAILPPRCVKCNAPATHRIQKTLYWHESWVYFLILAGVLVYAIVAIALRKQALVDWALCDKHKSQRTLGFVIAIVGFLAGLVGMIAGAAAGSGPAIIGGMVGMFVVPIPGLVMARNIAPKRIDDHYVWLKADPAFVESLPFPHTFSR